MDVEGIIETVALRFVEGLGDRNFRLLLDRFGSPGAVLRASWEEMQSTGIDPRIPKFTLGAAELDFAEKLVTRVREAGYWIVRYGGPGYPEKLGEIYDPPAVLYGAGIFPEDEFAIGVVGSRRATPHGLSVARKLGEELGRAGVTVVSGMAEGIDTAAHLGALEGGGKTIAVFGSGIDVYYPSFNAGLAERIFSGGGATISEHPLGGAPEARNFPRRNRIISGLCQGVVVVEAAKRSGSLVTARLALEQGREVFAVPGLAGSESARGANDLLRNGARLVESAKDIFDEFGLCVATSKERRKVSARFPEKGTSAGKIYSALEDAPVDIDTIAKRAGESPGATASALMELLLDGLVREWPGKRFSRSVN
ncbi:DNA-protecting protein DprA [bacterium]|nr:MAG: DNA-protecting protein DprA [bacterium]